MWHQSRLAEEGLILLSFDKGPSAREWARSADIATPVKWGDLEEQIISQRLTPEDGGDGPNWLLGAIMGIQYGLLLVFVMSPVLGAALVAWATAVDSRSVQGDLTLIATFMFIVSIVVSGSSLSMWWQTRTRSWVSLASGLVAVLSVVATFAVGLSYDGDLPGAGLELLALVAGGLGLLLVILQLVSKSLGRTGAGVPRGDRAQRRFSAAREEVLDVLSERGMVQLSSDQRHRMRRMRVGTWHKFDAQGRV